jgi:hypothetical protein
VVRAAVSRPLSAIQKLLYVAQERLDCIIENEYIEQCDALDILSASLDAAIINARVKPPNDGVHAGGKWLRTSKCSKAMFDESCRYKLSCNNLFGGGLYS